MVRERGRTISGTEILWFIARRLAALAVLLVVISFGVFTLLYIAPGSTEQILLGTRPQTPETLEAIREYYNLDQPLLSQYAQWLTDALRGDFGTSVRTSEPVLDAIGSRMRLTLWLGAYAFVLTLCAGIPLGILAAVKRRTFIDRAVVGLGVVGVSAPAFATGILLLYVFAILLGWFPTFGQGTGVTDRVWHLTLPAIALALTAIALVVKLTRAATITVLEQDYVAFARARGVIRRRVLIAYVLRNALVPITTGAGIILGYMLTGAVLVEVTFALPGVGSLLVESVNVKDVPMVQGLAMLVAVVVILVNLVTDLLYLFIDPRIRQT